MKHRTFLLTALAALLSTSLMPAGTLYLGTASVEITPPVGWRMAGNFYEKFSTGIHDPLYAKAMVWKQGNTRAEGSYEIVTSPLIPGSGETLVEATVTVLEDLSVKREHAQLGGQRP